MKKLLALLLLFGIVGCTSTTFNPPASQWQNTDDRGLCFTYYSNYGSGRNNDFKLMNYTRIINEIDRRNLNCRAFSEFSSKKDWMRNWVSSNAGNSSINMQSLVDGINTFNPNHPTFISNFEDSYKSYALPKAQARVASSLFIGDGSFHHGGDAFSNQTQVNEHVLNECERIFSEKCLISKQGNIDVWAVNQKNYKTDLAQQNINQEREKKLAVIKALKERCVTYGFTGDNNIAACVQREAQHDYDIEQKEYELKLAQYQLRAQQNQNQLLAQQSQPQVAPEVPWYLQALEAVALGLAEGIEDAYKQKALIQTMDARYAKKDIYRYCRPNC